MFRYTMEHQTSTAPAHHMVFRYTMEHQTHNYHEHHRNTIELYHSHTHCTATPTVDYLLIKLFDKVLMSMIIPMGQIKY